MIPRGKVLRRVLIGIGALGGLVFIRFFAPGLDDGRVSAADAMARLGTLSALGAIAAGRSWVAGSPSAGPAMPPWRG